MEKSPSIRFSTVRSFAAVPVQNKLNISPLLLIKRASGCQSDERGGAARRSIGASISGSDLIECGPGPRCIIDGAAISRPRSCLSSGRCRRPMITPYVNEREATERKKSLKPVNDPKFKQYHCAIPPSTPLTSWVNGDEARGSERLHKRNGPPTEDVSRNRQERIPPLRVPGREKTPHFPAGFFSNFSARFSEALARPTPLAALLISPELRLHNAGRFPPRLRSAELFAVSLNDYLFYCSPFAASVRRRNRGNAKAEEIKGTRSHIGGRYGGQISINNLDGCPTCPGCLLFRGNGAPSS
ncbi:hypothetical protein GWI33_019792, partial [Rhynchophorus ferrugineus]